MRAACLGVDAAQPWFTVLSSRAEGLGRLGGAQWPQPIGKEEIRSSAWGS